MAGLGPACATSSSPTPRPTSRRCGRSPPTPDLRREVTVTVDSVEHVRLLRDALGRRRRRASGWRSTCDASLRVGPAAPRRAPLADAHRRPRPSPSCGRPPGSGSRCAASCSTTPRSRGCRMPGRTCALAEAPLGARPRASGGGRSSTRCAARRTCASSTPAARAACTGSPTTRSSPSSRPGPASTRPTLFDGYDDFSPAAGDGLRPAGGAPARRGRRHGLRRRLRRERGAGVVAGAVAGAPRARARAHRGGRRGADARCTVDDADGLADRRPGVDARRQGGRAARAVRHGAPRARRASSSTASRRTAARGGTSDERRGATGAATSSPAPRRCSTSATVDRRRGCRAPRGGPAG